MSKNHNVNVLLQVVDFHVYPGYFRNNLGWRGCKKIFIAEERRLSRKKNTFCRSIKWRDRLFGENMFFQYSIQRMNWRQLGCIDVWTETAGTNLKITTSDAIGSSASRLSAWCKQLGRSFTYVNGICWSAVIVCTVWTSLFTDYLISSSILFACFFIFIPICLWFFLSFKFNSSKKW